MIIINLKFQKKDLKKKRKVTDTSPITSAVSNKKTKLSKNSDVKSSTVPSKKVKLSNGFTVEACHTLKPSLTNDTLTSDNKNSSKNHKACEQEKQNPKTKKIKLKLGENPVAEASSIPLEDMEAWSSMQIPEEILRALAEQGFKKPTKIQELTLPTAMLGK